MNTHLTLQYMPYTATNEEEEEEDEEEIKQVTCMFVDKTTNSSLTEREMLDGQTEGGKDRPGRKDEGKEGI